MIAKEHVETLLNLFDIGASTAENDPLLEAAKIETQEYYDLYHKDRIDIVKGIKGSGKTALYRLFYFLREYSADTKSLYCIFGIEASGDPVFRLFYEDFRNYGAIEFENFWNVYFILLINDLFNEDDKLDKILGKDKAELKKIISEIGINIGSTGYTLKDSISAIQKIFLSANIKMGMKAEINQNQSAGSLTPLLEIDPKILEDIKKKPIYIAEFRDRVKKILEKHGIKIWIMLDRLDEVFPHRSDIEKNGLKGLLKSSYNFSCPELRVKIFLRDDILEFISDEGFTALTHIADRCSSTMTWSKEELMLLVVKRLSAMDAIGSYYSIDKNQLDSLEYRQTLFNSVFPKKIGTTDTMDWIYTNLGDGNGIVTPRDIIDFFKYAKTEQLKAFKLNPTQQDKLITEKYFRSALGELSKHKKTTFLLAEFPHLKNHFLQFESGGSEYTISALKDIFLEDYTKIVEDLKSIGFLKYVPKSGTYKIPIIWRKGLNIKRKKVAKKVHH